MASTTYLHPVTISLSDIAFSKVDVSSPGTMAGALFALNSYGEINTPSITVDRVAGTVTYGFTTITQKTANVSMIGQVEAAASINEFSCTEVSANYPTTVTNGSAEPKEVLMGMIFNYMVQAIFSGGAALTQNLDVTDPNVRGNGLFFDDDAGSEVAAEVLAKTKGLDSQGAAANCGFGRVVTHTGGTDANADAEYDYWNVRTEHTNSGASNAAETNTIPFANGDVIYIKYECLGTFEAGTALANNANLSALESNAAVITPSPFAAANVTVSFILGWDIAI